MNTVDLSEYAARMAHASDVNAGLVPLQSWEQLKPWERDQYRRAVSGIPRERGATSIGRERLRQTAEEGFSAEHDDRHADAELVAAALAYATVAVMQQVRADAAEMLRGCPPPTGYGWPHGWRWNPAATSRENLIKAGALIAAELDRLDRLDARVDSLDDRRRLAGFNGGQAR